MFASSQGAALIEAMVDAFMDVRDRYAPKNTIRREAFDTIASSTIIDRGSNALLAQMKFAKGSPHQRIASLVVGNLLKLLYNLEATRFQKGDHTDGHDLKEAAKQRLKNQIISELMKGVADQHHLLVLWKQPEAREVSRRIAEHIFQEHGEEHGRQLPGTRW